MCLTQTIFFFAALQTPRFYNPSGAVAPAPFAQGSLLVCANIANNYKLRWQGRIPYPPAPTQSNFFRNCINFSARFFFVSAGAKKKLTKRNALFQRKLFEKSFLWTLSKTFPQLSPECRASAPKVTHQPTCRTAGAAFLQKAPPPRPLSFADIPCRGFGGVGQGFFGGGALQNCGGKPR